MRRTYKYKAFISYSHKDKNWAHWLQRALENYKIPKHLFSKINNLENNSSRLSPIFRDRDNLPAKDDLTLQIKDALANSEFLLVICSPNAAESPWVNKEIEEFKRQGKRRNILCIIARGEPNASILSDKSNALECFPRALQSKKNQKIEPIASDLRKGGDGKRLGLLKLVAGMIGVGLDEIIRRDLQRRHRRVTAITLVSVVNMLVMGGLLLLATKAQQKAELKQTEAEGLIEFMLTDLREKLEPVGRLDVLDAVGDKAISYYATQQLQGLPEDSLGRQARAYHLLGEIDELQGNLENAQTRFEAASTATKALLDRAPNNQKRIFEHAQSVFWIAAIKWRRGNYQEAEADFIQYRKLADKLVALDPENLDWQLEVTYSISNLGSLYLMNLEQPEKASEIFKDLLTLRLKLFGPKPNDPKRALDLANTYGWLADSTKISGTLSEAENFRREQISILESVIENDPDNIYAKGESLTARLGLARIEIAQGEALYAVSRLESLVKDTEQLIAHDSDNVNWLRRAARHYLYLTEVYLLVNLLNEANLSLNRSGQLIESYSDKTMLFFREKVQLTYLHQLLKAKISYEYGDIGLAFEVSNNIIQNMTKDIGEGSRASNAHQILSEAFLLAGFAALNMGDEAAAITKWNALVYLLESRIDIESPETLIHLVNAYYLLGKSEKATSLDLILKNKGFEKNTIYSSSFDFHPKK